MRRALAGAVATTLASAAIAVLPTTPMASAAESGTFTTLTYNIAGLPEALSSAPTPRVPATRAIGQRLGPYDIVHVQEDFNYHAYLYAADNHPYRTATSGGVPFGSGLNTLSNFAYDVGDFERVTWNACNLNSGDCLTPKGFTLMRARLGKGVLPRPLRAWPASRWRSGWAAARPVTIGEQGYSSRPRLPRGQAVCSTRA